MKPASKAQILAPFANADPKTIETLRTSLDSPGLTGAVLTQPNALNNDVEIWLYGPGCTFTSIENIPAFLRVADGTLHYYRDQRIKPAQLVRDLLALGVEPSKASLLAGVHRSMAYREKHDQQDRGVCPCCGRLLPRKDGQEG